MIVFLPVSLNCLSRRGVTRRGGRGLLGTETTLAGVNSVGDKKKDMWCGVRGEKC